MPESSFSTLVEPRLASVGEILPALGSELCAWQRTDLQIRSKGNELDLVTRADLHSEKTLVGFLREKWPGDGIVAEEGSRTKNSREGEDGFAWVIDPIDGTVNYANGLAQWAVSIGLCRGDQVVGGLVAAPALGLLYRAVRGGGAFCNGNPIRVNGKDRLRSGLVATGFPYHRERAAGALSEAVKALLDQAGDVRRFGSAALDLCQVAAGQFIGYCEISLNAWDVAAGSLILEEAGGMVSDLEGAPYQLFSSPGIVASNGLVHAELIALAGPFRRAAAAEGQGGN